MRNFRPSSSHVPHTTPPETTTGAIQPAVRLTSAAARARRDVAVLRARAEHVLVEAGEQSDGRGRLGCRELVGVLGEDPRALAVHLDLDDCVAEVREPGRIRFLLNQPPETQSEKVSTVAGP